MHEAVSEAPHHKASASILDTLGDRLNYLLYFADILVLGGSAIAAHYILGREGMTGKLPLVSLIALFTVITYSFFAFSSGLYDWRRFRHQLKNPTGAVSGVLFAFGCLLIVGFVFKVTDDVSRLWISVWLLSVILYVPISRFALSWHLDRPRQRRLMQRRAIIIGTGQEGQDVADHLLRFDDHDIRVVGFLDDRASRAPAAYRGIPVLGGTHWLGTLMQHDGPDLVIVALPRIDVDRVKGVLTDLSHWCVDVYLAPDRLGLDHAHRPTHRLGGMNLLSLKDRPISEWAGVVKRIEDLCIAVPTLILLSPLLALIAIAIRVESKGHVLFVQERYGFNNNLIRVYKFRSMHKDMTDIHAEQLASRNDPRITKVGRFIRRTSLDELPQLFNVLLGNMSVVGPRPHATRAKAGDRLYQEAVTDYASRHRVKPGITGWAQCNGWRGETDTEEKIKKRVEHDLYYIENWSVFLDLLVIFKTFMLLVKEDENAY